MSPRKKRIKNVRCAISQAKRHRIFEMDCYQCVYCGVGLPRDPGPFRTVDHLIPVRELFGMPTSIINRIDNLVSACRECNLSTAPLNYQDKVVRYGRFANA